MLTSNQIRDLSRGIRSLFHEFILIIQLVVIGWLFGCYRIEQKACGGSRSDDYPDNEEQNWPISQRTNANPTPEKYRMLYADIGACPLSLISSNYAIDPYYHSWNTNWPWFLGQWHYFFERRASNCAAGARQDCLRSYDCWSGGKHIKNEVLHVFTKQVTLYLHQRGHAGTGA